MSLVSTTWNWKNPVSMRVSREVIVFQVSLPLLKKAEIPCIYQEFRLFLFDGDLKVISKVIKRQWNNQKPTNQPQTFHGRRGQLSLSTTLTLLQKTLASGKAIYILLFLFKGNRCFSVVQLLFPAVISFFYSFPECRTLPIFRWVFQLPWTLTDIP